MSSLTSLDPQSPQARAIYDLNNVAWVIFGLIFAAVTGAIIYSLRKYRWREGDAEPRQLAGNKKVEIIWTAVPFLIVLVLFILTARTMSIADPPAAPEPDLIVVGHQWWWEARYPKTGAIVANEIHLPVGRPFSVRLEATDVLHEFWVAELARKMTTVPGHPNHIWLQADKTGTYNGICSEFCGTQHAWMRFLLVAEAPEQFEAWQQTQLRPAPAPTDDLAAHGLALFQASSCINCHAINGTAATARVAPDLTHIASRRQLGAGIVENTPENLRRWLKDPQVVKPGVKMPNYNFTDEQLAQLGAYFKTLQ
ncbi:MAG: cytochrome c oxidase subunit II [Verrucomicrobia bacterium]|nr:cytochrome c oxidase subunit II [Verrucomicrobiota bacterium]